VEPNTRVWALAPAACETQGGETDPVSWGQVRTSSGEEPDDDNEGHYVYSTTDGADTESYIIDTGIQITHDDFENRAVWGTNTIDNSDSDGNGHGTHVASTVGGKVWGIAKSTNLVAVKVLGASGGGTWQSVIEGIQWSVSDAESNGNIDKSTSNMSLGGGKQTSVNDATDAAADAGMIMVVAAGNSNNDACTLSPASADKAVTVMSSDQGNNGGKQVDIRSTFSSYGTCTQAIAPGSDITGAWIGSDSATRTISGTSMASPHVCGVANALLSQGVAPGDVLAKLQESAHKDVVEMNCSNQACNDTPNLLAHLNCEDN